MPRLRRLDRACALEPRSQVRRTERIPRRRGVHHTLDFLCRHFERLTLTPNQASLGATLEHHFGRADLLVRAKHRRAIGEMEQRLFVIDGQQRQVDIRQHAAVSRPRLLDRGPQPWPVVIVEDDSRIALAGLDQGFQQLFPALHAQYRQGNAAEIQHVVVRQRRQNRRGGRRSEAIAHRCFIAPVKETTLASGVGLDAIQPRQTSGQALHHAQANVFFGPALAHGITETVIAQGRDVVHRARAAQLSGQVHRGVQGIATEALAQAAVGMVLQLDHAFADQGNARGMGAQGVKGAHGCGGSGVLCCLGGRARPHRRSPSGVGASVLAMAATRF